MYSLLGEILKRDYSKVKGKKGIYDWSAGKIMMKILSPNIISGLFVISTSQGLPDIDKI